MFTTLNVSCVTCHVSRVTCHMSHVTCHFFSPFFYFLFFGKSGEAYRWRVCYQRGLPLLVLWWSLLSKCFKRLLVPFLHARKMFRYPPSSLFSQRHTSGKRVELTIVLKSPEQVDFKSVKHLRWAGWRIHFLGYFLFSPTPPGRHPVSSHFQPGTPIMAFENVRGVFKPAFPSWWNSTKRQNPPIHKMAINFEPTMQCPKPAQHSLFYDCKHHL